MTPTASASEAPVGWLRPRLAEAGAVAVGAVLLVALLLFIEGPRPDLRSDQEWGSLMALKHLHPDWLVGDLFYGTEAFRGYNPLFFAVQAWIARWYGGDLVEGLRVLAWPVGWLFVAGHYALFRYVGAGWAGAALGTLGALTVRNALGGENWGFGGVRDVLPRVAFLGLAPLLTIAFLHCRERRWLPAYYLGLGLLANVHPVSGLHLAEATGATHLVLDRFRLRAWLDVGMGAATFTLGVLPFVFAYFPRQEPLADPTLAPVARAALDYRFSYLFYPLKLEALLSVAFHMLLPALLLGWVLWRCCSPRLRVLAVLGAAGVVLGLIGTAGFQLVGVMFDRPYPDVHQLRATKFAYLALLAGLPLALTALLMRSGWRPRAAAALLVALAVVPPGELIHATSGQTRAAVKRALGIAVPAPPVPTVPAPDREENARAYRAMVAWVCSHAARNDLFLTDDFSYRWDTLRPITGSFKDGGILTAGPGPLVRWYRYMEKIEACRSRAGEGCWLPLGRQLGAHYAIVDPSLTRVGPEPWAERVWAQAGWSVWRLGGTHTALLHSSTEVTGPRDNFDLETAHVIPALIRKCLETKRAKAPTVTCWGRGKLSRDFLYVEDAAEAVLLAAQRHTDSAPVNLGSGSEVSMRDLAELIRRATDYPGDLVWDASRPDGQPRRCLDTSRAERPFGFRARSLLEVGLERTVAWYLTAERAG